MNRLDGKVAFLSGAARGIGGATAKLMASAGAQVVIGDILDEREALQRLAESHVVGEDGTQSIAPEQHQPRESFGLIRPERGAKIVRERGRRKRGDARNRPSSPAVSTAL